MLLEHNKATAKLTIDGLALCSFNKKEELWEVGFLRYENHELMLKVGNLELPIPPEKGVAIRIETERDDELYNNQYKDGFFDQGPPDRRNYPNPDELENFRWVMDLDSQDDVPEHGQNRRKQPWSYPVTMAYIRNAVFYTKSVSDKDLYRLLIDEDPTHLGNQIEDRKLGKEASLIGADIYCKPGERITITVGGEELEYPAGNPLIQLTNMPGAHALPQSEQGARSIGSWAQGDFKLFYDAIAATDKKYSLWGIVRENESRRSDCNPASVNDGKGLTGLTA